MIESLADWNAHLGCCCGMPECPEPIMECVSSSISLSAAGWVDPADTDWMRYLTKRTGLTQNGSRTITVPANGDYPAYDSFTETQSVDAWVDRTYSGYLEGGGPAPCPEWEATISDECNVSATYTSTTTERFFYGGPPADYIDLVTRTVTQTVFPVAGEQTDEYNEWLAGGEIGGPPTRYYPECYWKSHTVETDYDHSVPSTGYAGTEETVIEYDSTYAVSTVYISSLFPGIVGFPYSATAVTYTGSINHAGWIALATAEILAAIDLDNSSCVSTDCHSSHTTGEYSLSLGAASIQFLVPTSHFGSYFKVTFDVIDEPDGWASQETDPRTFAALDVTREWTGPGNGPQDDPSWELGAPYLIDPPSTPGIRRIVNIRFECYRGEEPAP